MTDQEAIHRCQQGDREAFRQLVDRYRDVLFGTAVLMTGNRAVAEEQVQEALLSAWRGIRGFRPGNPAKPWLVRILVNAVLSQQRRRALPTVQLGDSGPDELRLDSSDPSAALDALEDLLALRRAIAELSPDHRQVVALRYFAGLTVPETARALGVREGTVKSRLHRALAVLREQLDERSHPDPPTEGEGNTPELSGRKGG